MNVRKKGVDHFRLIAVGMVVATYTFPFSSVLPKLDEVITLTLFRVAIPFFLMTTGYFLIGPLAQNNTYITRMKVNIYLLKLIKIYGIVLVLYLPFSFSKGALNLNQSGIEWLKRVVFEGTFYHLWYFPSILLGVVFVGFFLTKVSFKMTMGISLFLYAIGLLGDSWYGLIKGIPILENMYQVLFQISDMTRNGLLFTPLFLCLGGLIYLKQEKKQLRSKENLFLCLLFLSLMLVESSLLHLSGNIRHDSMYLFLPAVMYFFYFLLLDWEPKTEIKQVSRLSTLIYVIHPIIIMGIHFIASRLPLLKFSLVYFLLVFMISYGVSNLILLIVDKYHSQKEKPSSFRVEREISSQAVSHNLKEIQRVIPRNTQVMAVVKANAYGTDLVEYSKLLAKNGVDFFAVATIDEAIQLRRKMISGDILVLGYTDVSRVKEIKKYDLVQSLVSEEYARRLNQTKEKIRCHLQVDTGMHRLGVEADTNIIISLYRLRYLKIEGIYSHLGSSDSLDDKSVARTERQLITYCDLLNELKQNKIKYGITHIQSSYGIVNYPEYQFDYVRAGIMLYGFLSSDETIKTSINLMPSIQIKAKLISKRLVKAGEYLGYGTDIKLSQHKLVGIVSIGYADGLPRSLSNSGYGVYYQDRLLPQVGNICMDMLIVDLSDVEEIPIDAEVVALSEFEGLAKSDKTITNETLSQLGNRFSTCVLN